MINLVKKILLFSLLLLIPGIILISLSENEEKNSAQNYLNSLDSIIVKMETLQKNCQAFLLLNETFKLLNYVPVVDPVAQASKNWADLEKIYKNEYTALLKSSKLVGNEKANKNRFDELTNRAALAYGKWLFRDIAFASIKKQDASSKSTEIIKSCLDYYNLRNSTEIELSALSELVSAYNYPKANYIVSTIQNKYLKTISYVKVGNFHEAITNSKRISDTTQLLNALIVILKAKPEDKIIKEALQQIVNLTNSKDFRKNFIYSTEKIVEAVAFYSKKDAFEIVELIPSEFPDVKASCLLRLMEMDKISVKDDTWNGINVRKLLNSIDNKFARETLLAKYIILKAGSDVHPLRIKVKFETQTLTNMTTAEILMNYAKKNPLECFIKANKLITDPTMIFKVQLFAFDNMTFKDKKEAVKYIELLYASLSDVPDKSILSELVASQFEYDYEKACDKIAEIENPMIRCRSYADLSDKAVEKDIHLSEVLFRKAINTYNSIQDMEISDKIKLMSNIAISRSHTKPEESKFLLEKLLSELISEKVVLF